MAKTTKQFHFFLVIIPFFFLSLNSFAQQRIKNVTGKVTANTGEVIQGVSVNVEGTEKGTITDTSGVYKIKDVTDAATLVFSHVGFTTRRVVVSNRIRIDIALREDNTALNEVVVTALGIKQQAKSLVYSTQSVKASQLTEVRDPNNFLNSLQGKVVNAQITQSSGGVGSKAQIILRGNRSISGSNTALIVVDGVPDLSNTMPNINPDDIMSITILPSASAGVLYGSQAGNGAIIITTKKGTKGKTSVNVNSGLVFESPFALPKFQNVYGQGNNGVIDPVLGDSWGAKMGGQSYTNYLGEQSTYSPQPNNINDFFNNGISLNNSISVSSGTEKMQTYLSYVNKDVHGIVPNNDLMSHTVSLRITNQISKRFSTDAKLNYLQQDIKHKLRGEEGFFPVGNEENNGPVFDLYQMPRNVSVVDAMKYQTINSLGISVPTPWPSVIASTYQNPYWVINNDVINERMDVISGFLNTKFEITNWLSVTGRANLQKSFIGDEQSVKVGTIEFATKPGGYYSQSNTISFQKWFDVIFEGTNKITTNLNINYHAGAIYQDNSYSKNDAIADGLNVANKFSLNFATNPTLMSVGNRIQTQSVFGQFNLSYKRLIYFDGSLRNDWDSRLPSPHSFQYYSAGLSGVLSDLITLPKFMSFLKGSITYAEVGNGGQFGLLTPSYIYSQGAGNGYLSRSTVLPFPGLKPEIVKNLEAGIQVRFINNRLGFNVTYYKSNSFNQLIQVPIPVATGYTSQYINAGNIENHGLEFVLDASPVKNRDFSWELAFNISLNRNKVIKLSDNLGPIYQGDFKNFGAIPQIKEGGSFDDLISDQWQKDAKGNYMVTAKGLPLFTSQSGQAPGVIGNYSPKEILGLTNTFTYRNFSLRILTDGQLGGIMFSNTEQNLAFSGITEVTAKNREGGWNLGGVDVNGNQITKDITAQQFWQTVSAKLSGVGEFFTYDATNFRIREISFGYKIPLPFKSIIKSASISVVARNLLWLYRGSSILDIPGLGKRKMWFDPNMSKYAPGTEYGANPSTRSLGFNLQVSF